MAVSVSKLSGEKIYKDPSIKFDDYPIVKGKEQMKDGRLVVGLNDLQDMIKIINADGLFYKYTRSFYVDKKWSHKIRSSKITVNNTGPQTSMYRQVREECPGISFTYPNLSSYDGENMYYFLGSKMKHLINSEYVFGGLNGRNAQVKEFKRFVQDHIVNTALWRSYPKIDIYFYIDENNRKYKEINQMAPTRVCSDFITLIYSIMAHEGPEELVKIFTPKDGNTNISFYCVNETRETLRLFKLPQKKTELKLGRIKAYHNAMRKAAKKADKEDERAFMDTSDYDWIMKGLDDMGSIPSVGYNDRYDPLAFKLLKKAVGVEKATTYLTSESSPEVTKLGDEIGVTVDAARKAKGGQFTEEVTKEIEQEIKAKKDEGVSEAIKNYERPHLPGLSKAQVARLNKVVEDSETVELDRTHIPKAVKLKEEQYKDGVVRRKKVKADLSDESMSYNTVREFDDTYFYGMYYPDIIKTLKCFSRGDKSIPLYLKSAELTPSSDSMTKKEDLRVVFTDSNLKTHTFKVALPVVVDSNKLFIGGNWKAMYKQICMFPLVKTDANEVQVISNQNKCFLSRSGNVTSLGVDIIKNYFNNPGKYKSATKFGLKEGRCTASNAKFAVHVDYSSLGDFFYKFKTKSYTVIFDQAEIRDRVADKLLKKDLTNCTVVAYTNEGMNPIIADENGLITVDKEKLTITEWLLDRVFPEVSGSYNDLSEIKATRRLSHSEIMILSRKVPLVLFLSYMYGLTNVLEASEVEWSFEPKKPKFETLRDKINKKIVRFKDGYLVYSTKKTADELLFNGLSAVPTKNYNFIDMDDEDEYLDIFGTLTRGTNRITKGFKGFKEVFFDSKTIDVLDRLGLNDNLLDLCIMGNKMLENTSFTGFGKIGAGYNKRLRPPAENIIVALYKAISEEYLKFVRLSFSKEIPKSVSVPYNAVMRHIGENPLIEGYDKVNPLKEAETRAVCSFKGPGGLNVLEGYSKDKRTFDESMLGIFSIVGSQGTIGINRYLSINPPIKDGLGFLDDVDTSKLKSGDLCSPCECATPMTRNDDGKRRVFTMNQGVQFIPSSKHTSEPPIITGYERVISGSLGGDFVKKAKFPGKVIEVDEKDELLTVEYKLPDKTTQTDIFSFRNEVIKNGGAGIHLPNKLSCIVKVGDTFKADDVLVQNKEFFAGDKDPSLMMGKLAKILLTTCHRTNEDSTSIRREFGKDMAADIVDCKKVSMSGFAVIEKIAKIGDFVKAGEPLVVFQNVYGDHTGDASAMLAQIKEDQKGKEEDDEFFLKKMPSSKFSGVIEDIKIYYTVAPEELGEDVKKVVNSYNNVLKRRNKKILSKSADTERAEDSYVGVTEPNNGMINGEYIDVGDVLIEFYIRFNDIYKIGDKASLHSAAKTVTGFSADGEKMPYGHHRPDEPIDIEMAFESLENRLVKSPPLALYCNKVMVELKYKIADIVGKKAITSAMKKQIQKLIIETVNILEPKGFNKAKYTRMFKGMSDAAFSKFVKDKLNDDGRFFQLEVSSYDKGGFPTFPNIKKAAKYLDIPLDEKITYPHFDNLTDGDDERIQSQTVAPVGYLLMRTPVQRVVKKSKQSVNVSTRDPITGQSTKSTKGGRVSYVDVAVMTAVGLDNCVREFTTVRADNMEAKSEALEAIKAKGSLRLSELDIDTSKNVSVRSADQLLTGAFLKTNLITEKYKIVSSVKDSYDKGRGEVGSGKTAEQIKREREQRERVERGKAGV